MRQRTSWRSQPDKMSDDDQYVEVEERSEGSSQSYVSDGSGFVDPSGDFLEVLVDHCRGLFPDKNGKGLICINPATCRRADHANLRAVSVTRGLPGFYQAATTRSGRVTAVFANTRISAEDLGTLRADERMCNRLAVEGLRTSVEHPKPHGSITLPLEVRTLGQDILGTPVPGLLPVPLRQSFRTPPLRSTLLPSTPGQGLLKRVPSMATATVPMLSGQVPPPPEHHPPPTDPQWVTLQDQLRDQITGMTEITRAIATLHTRMEALSEEVATTTKKGEARMAYIMSRPPSVPAAPVEATGPAANSDATPPWLPAVLQRLDSLQPPPSPHLVVPDTTTPATYTQHLHLPPTHRGPFYAVAKGKDASSVGIYPTWSEASREVTGVSGAVHMKFSRAEDAARFVESYQMRAPDPQQHQNNLVGSPKSPTPSFIGPDISTGKAGELFGVQASSDKRILDALSPTFLTDDEKVRLGEEILDVTGLPGRTGSGGSTGFLDTTWKNRSRTSLGRSVTSLDILRERVTDLRSCQERVLAQMASNLANVFVMAGFTDTQASEMGGSSLFYRIGRDTLSSYVGLHIHLLDVALHHNFRTAKLEIDHHVHKLREIRGVYGTRLQVVCQVYTYLRDGQDKAWMSLALQEKRMTSFLTRFEGSQAVVESDDEAEAGPLTTSLAQCKWCFTTLHTGGKPQCPWKGLTKVKAKKCGTAALRNLGRFFNAEDGSVTTPDGPT